MESAETGRAFLGDSHRTWASRLAHRVFRDGHEISRRDTGYSHWWNRPGISAPRERNCAERGRDWETFRALLAACRAPACRGRKDVQIAGKLLHTTRFVCERL